MFRCSPYRIMMTVVGTALLAGGCGTTEPSRFYTLSALPESGPTPVVQAETQQGGIGIGPVSIPQYLDRPQIVTRLGANRFEIAEFDRWGGALQDEFKRALAENLVYLFPGRTVARFPWRRTADTAYQIPVEVIRFDGELGQSVELVAQWQILADDGNRQLFSKRSSFSQPLRGSSYEDLVAAQSRAVADFAREIANELKNMKGDTRAQ